MTNPAAARGPAAYPLCAEACPDWEALLAGAPPDPARLPAWLVALAAEGRIPAGLPDVARLDRARAEVERAGAADLASAAAGTGGYRLSPGLQLLRLSSRAASWAEWPHARTRRAIAPGEEWAVVWHDRHCGALRVEPATTSDLLALKLVAEELGPDALAPRDRLLGAHALRVAASKGMLLGRGSAIRRRGSALAGAPARFAFAGRFSLQWHITQACDLGCRHCYDRSRRPAVTLDEGLRVLDDLVAFCERMGVLGEVVFTGGNPLLHPHVEALAAAADARDLYVSVLGNPVPRPRLARLLAAARPERFQVSLEGREAVNDAVRGPGSFRAVLEFLEALREVGVPSAVMMTVSQTNLDEVLPLARQLAGRADTFTFCRLARFGEARDLELPARDELRALLEAYDRAADGAAGGLRRKDNLFAILADRRGEPWPGGCTDFGCGAAFNFLALLPDGEVHACRKLPSPLGRFAGPGSLARIWESPLAARYREGSRACAACRLRPACGGCLAVAAGLGLDPLEARDPHCFVDA